VIVYKTWYEEAEADIAAVARLADSVRAEGVEVLAFCMDQYDQPLRELPGLLRRNHAPFPPVHIYDWWKGTLVAALDSAGARLMDPFMLPVIMLVGPDGRPLGSVDGVIPPAAEVLRRFRSAP